MDDIPVAQQELLLIPVVALRWVAAVAVIRSLILHQVDKQLHGMAVVVDGQAVQEPVPQATGTAVTAEH